MDLRSLTRHALLVLALLFLTTSAAAAPPKRDPAFEQKLDEQLRAKDPDAVPIFRQATNAANVEKLDEAATGFEAVLERVPTFSPAARRLCYTELGRNHRERAISLCRDAVAMDPSADNRATLAMALMGGPPTPEEDAEAMTLLRAATQQEPNNALAQTLLCKEAVDQHDALTARGCTDALLRLEPNEPYPHYYASILAAVAGDFATARREAEIAHEKGISEELYQKLISDLEAAQPWYQRGFARLWPVLAGWACGFLLLVLVGFALSGATVRAVAKLPRKAAEPPAGALRKVYRAVLTLVSFYYFVSLPIVALLIVAFTGFLLVGSFTVGDVPLKFVVAVVLISLYVLFAMARSLRFDRDDEDPGLRLDLEDHEALRKVLGDVAKAVGTRTVDEVYLVPGSTLSMTESGGFWKQARGRGARELVLGVGALDGLGLGPFKALLAHECGHFRHEGTAGGDLALSVRRSLELAEAHMEENGISSSFNPAWWLVAGFRAAFLRLSQGAVQLQEVLADVRAAKAYGSAELAAGLAHLPRRAVTFEAHTAAVFAQVKERKGRLQNLYTYELAEPLDEDVLEAEVDKARHPPPAPFESHPRPKERDAWLAAMKVEGKETVTPDDEGPAWAVFGDREAIEEAMTAVLAKKHRVAVDAAEDEKEHEHEHDHEHEHEEE